uniref:Uncharacterized protein n=1 Tax=Arion vulgaris TaxID=1028688 RepID=A0A0B6ZEY2_9EUPU
MAGNLLVDFRLSKGDGLEFKRHFVKIKTKLKHIIRKTQPNWQVSGFDDIDNASLDSASVPSAPATNVDIVSDVIATKNIIKGNKAEEQQSTTETAVVHKNKDSDERGSAKSTKCNLHGIQRSCTAKF